MMEIATISLACALVASVWIWSSHRLREFELRHRARSEDETTRIQALRRRIGEVESAGTARVEHLKAQVDAANARVNDALGEIDRLDTAQKTVEKKISDIDLRKAFTRS